MDLQFEQEVFPPGVASDEQEARKAQRMARNRRAAAASRARKKARHAPRGPADLTCPPRARARFALSTRTSPNTNSRPLNPSRRSTSSSCRCRWRACSRRTRSCADAFRMRLAGDAARGYCTPGTSTSRTRPRHPCTTSRRNVSPRARSARHRSPSPRTSARSFRSRRRPTTSPPSTCRPSRRSRRPRCIEQSAARPRSEPWWRSPASSLPPPPALRDP